MQPKPNYSSTMRIDLIADTDEPTGVETSTGETADRHLPSSSEPLDEASECELVGSADFRELLQSVYDAAIITDIEGHIIRGNRRAEQFFQYNVTQFYGLHITDLISGSDASLLTTIRESLKNDRFILIQAYCTRADHSVFPAEVSVNLLRLSGRDYISFFIRDVTFRKEAEERLRTGHAAIQNSGNGIAVTDSEASLEYCNPAMSILLGIDSDQAPAPQLTTLLTNPKLGEKILDTAAQGSTWSGEMEMVTAAGNTVFVQASVAPNVDADGEVVGMVWSLLDISGQKRIQNELVEHNAQLAEDLSLANEFQLAFIQREYPTFPPGVASSESAIELGHVYIPSGAVGGDFFEIFAVSMERVGIFISDVMGHGMRSALIVATIRGLLEELGPFRFDPAAFLSHMNSDLSRIINHPGHTMFATAFYMVLDLTTGEVSCASAGHPSPMLLHPGQDSVNPLFDEHRKADPALGLFPSTTYRQENFTMAPDDGIVLYTDGIYEAENCDCEGFDAQRMSETLNRRVEMPVSPMLEQLVKDVQSFCGRQHFDDDVCLVGMKLRHLLTTTATE